MNSGTHYYTAHHGAYQLRGYDNGVPPCFVVAAVLH